jgi:outer membrane cobalamin receptor
MGFWDATVASAQESKKIPSFEETELMFLGEELYTVSIASRRIETLQRAPAAVTVITHDELKKYTTLADVLRQVPGFFIDQNEVNAQIYLRGIPNSFLVMMDGVPFSCDASTIDYPRGFELSLDYIEKIEIIRGPGSALWGPDAFSGIINLVTKKGADIQGIALSTEGGSFDSKRAQALGGFNKYDWDGIVSLSTTKTEGFEYDLHNGEERPHDHYFEAYGKLSYKDVLEVSGRYSRYRDFYTEPTFIYEGAESKPFSFIQATVNKSIENASFSLQGWYQYFGSEDDYGQPVFKQHNKQYGLEGKTDFTLFENNYLTIGSSCRYNNGSKTVIDFEDQKFDNFPSYFTRLYSGYFQDKWKINKNLEATAGLRYDNHSIYGGFYSPRAGLSYLFLEYFNAKLLYGRAFRTPTLAFISQNISLDPERIDSYEAELGFHYKNIFGATVNFFYNELENIIEPNVSGTISNSGGDNIKGVELSVTGRPYRNLLVYANYTHLAGNRQRGLSDTIKVPSSEDPSQNTETTIESFFNVAPNNVANVGIDYSFLNHYRTTLELNYVGERKLARGLETVYGERRKLGSYVLCNVNFFIKDLPVRNFELRLKLNNIFNKQYKTRGVFGLVDGAESSTYLLLSYKF